MRALLVMLCLITILAALFLGACVLSAPSAAPMALIPLAVIVLNVALIVATATRKAPSLKPLFFMTGGIDLVVAAWLALMGLRDRSTSMAAVAAAFALKGVLALVIPVWAARPPRDPPPPDDAARPGNPFADG